MRFFEVAIPEITIRFFKFVWEILPIQPTIQTRGEKSAPPLFLEDEIIFQKSASVVPRGIREKGGVLMLLKTTLHLEAKAQTSRSVHVVLSISAGSIELNLLC
jgi:hypothetical protein